jgi:cytochrome c
MKSRMHLALLAIVAAVVTDVGAQDLGFEGHDLVEPDCGAMSSWYQCREIDTAPPGVFLGYLYMHHTSETLGPDGNTVYPDTGEPYVTTVTACSSCHFTGGQVPFGSPVYQSPSKYQPNPETGLGPYFTPLGYYRDLEDSVIDCFRNCMNAERAPEKDDPVMVALVEYIHWVSDGIIDPAMKDDWNLLPPEAGPKLPSIAGVAAMRADPFRGASLYDDQCSGCHDDDGPGAGEYKLGEERPRVPALWGDIDGYSKGAAFYRTPVLGAYAREHMPYGDPGTLSDQDAIDIAAFINAPDKPRPEGMADEMYVHDDPDGIPSSLRKPADWLVGFEYPGEREHFEAQGIDYEDMVLNGPWEALAAWRAAEIALLQEDDPWTDLGQGLAGTGGVTPTLTPGGPLTTGSTITLKLDGALPLGSAWLVVGFTALNAPFKGGTLVPDAEIVLPMPVSATGEIDLAFTWPPAPSGVDTFVQYWIQDPVGPKGFSASHAVQGTTP